MESLPKLPGLRNGARREILAPIRADQGAGEQGKYLVRHNELYPNVSLIVTYRVCVTPG